MTENEIKAIAIMDFVGSMVGAYEANFVTTPILTLGQLYQVARNHVKDSYGFETNTLAQEMGQDFADLCNPRL